MIQSLKDLNNINKGEKIILLYSGGLDSTYLLYKLYHEVSINIIALNIDVGGDEVSISIPKFSSVNFLKIDAKDEFINNFVLKALTNNGRYLGNHPLSASLSRPLFAKTAIEVANQENSSIIIHSATSHQNSLRRFNGALKDLGFMGEFGSPFQYSDIKRAEKIKYLEKYNVIVPELRSQSFDTNLWAKEHEGEDHNSAPEIAKNHDSVKRDAINISIVFSNGIPIKVNSELMKSNELITYLNDLGTNYNLGEYSSFEENGLGELMYEQKSAPGAYILLESYWMILSKILPHDQLLLKNYLDQIWTKEASEGRWFGPLKKSIESFNDSIKILVNYEIEIKLSNGLITFLNIENTSSTLLEVA